jgi:hypothetical protein
MFNDHLDYFPLKLDGRSRSTSGQGSVGGWWGGPWGGSSSPPPCFVASTGRIYARRPPAIAA